METCTCLSSLKLYILSVSEGLSSVETTVIYLMSGRCGKVSEGLSSVETPPYYHIIGYNWKFQKDLVVWKRILPYTTEIFITVCFRRT